jgi:transcriptional pleiotropic regulator of transition state genes
MLKKVNRSGGLTFPAAFRREHNIQPGDVMDINMVEGSIVVDRARPRCTFCHSNEDVKVFNDNHVCVSCLDKLKNEELEDAAKELFI